MNHQLVGGFKYSTALYVPVNKVTSAINRIYYPCRVICENTLLSCSRRLLSNKPEMEGKQSLSFYLTDILIHCSIKSNTCTFMQLTGQPIIWQQHNAHKQADKRLMFTFFWCIITVSFHVCCYDAPKDTICICIYIHCAHTYSCA